MRLLQVVGTLLFVLETSQSASCWDGVGRDVECQGVGEHLIGCEGRGYSTVVSREEVVGRDEGGGVSCV